MKQSRINYIVILLVTLFFGCTKEVSEIPSIPKVGIQPLGHFDQGQMAGLKQAIFNTYGFEAVFLDEKPLPDSTFVNVKTPRYRADKLLKYLNSIRPDTIDYILGVTEKDISTTKFDSDGEIKKPAYKYEDWGVFGLGNRPGRAGVISSYRLSGDTAKVTTRLVKVGVHELGHNLGLKHCSSGQNCVMQDAAETMQAMDTVRIEPCAVCWATIEQ